MTPVDLDAIEARLEVDDCAEIWRPIVGADGYEVSDQGRVRSWWMRGGKPTRVRADEPRILSGRVRAASGGYASVSLPRGPGRSYGTKAIHRLVIETFVGPCPDGLEVAHLNGDSMDNRAANLAYVTHAENEHHKKLHGTWDTRKGGAKLTAEQVSEIKGLLSRGFRQSDVARVFDLDKRQINDIARGKTWADVAPTDLAALVAEVKRLRAVAEAAREYRRTAHTYVQYSRPERDAWSDLIAALDALDAVGEES